MIIIDFEISCCVYCLLDVFVRSTFYCNSTVHAVSELRKTVSHEAVIPQRLYWH